MTPDGDRIETDARSTEERAEELVEAIVRDGSRWLGRVIGRLREEVEDIVAEGREIHDGSRSS